MFDLKHHQNNLKIDAMFFSGSDDRLLVLGEEFKRKG